MPTCDPLILTPVAREIIQIQPRSVLDVGVGYGKWGLLVREYADVWKHHRIDPGDWEVDITGVEIYAPYETSVWGVYDRVHKRDALTLMDDPEWLDRHFDLGIMIDVIEHMPRGLALPFLVWLKDTCKHLIISYSNHEQKGVGNNPNEDHVSKWTPADFPWPKHLLAGNEKSWALYRI